jgi:hypothetical protein
MANKRATTLLAGGGALRWKSSEEYDRSNARYIRRRRSRDRFMYRRLVLGAALLIVGALAVFLAVHYVA